ncbi:MAG: MBL fold metallo-hydrolase [Gammaproteobacteria bacterium]
MAAGRQGLDRRAFITGAAGTAVAAGLGPMRLAAQAADPGVSSVAHRIDLLSGLGGNIVSFEDDEGLVLVDSGAAEHAATLLDGLTDRAGSKPVRLLFNTHWHLDQVGSNARIGQSGAEIVAHAKTHAHLAIPHYLPAEDRYQPALPAEAHPTRTFRADGMVEAGDEAIEFGYLLEAHTDGDIYVRFQQANVIAAGDAISPLRDPELDWYGGGWLGGRLDSLKLLLDLSDGDTKFVPSYGPVVDRTYVQSEHDLMLGLYEILWERIRAGESAEDIHASGALDSLPRRFADPMRLLYSAHKSMWAHYNTLSPDIV